MSDFIIVFWTQCCLASSMLDKLLQIWFFCNLSPWKTGAAVEVYTMSDDYVVCMLYIASDWQNAFSPKNNNDIVAALTKNILRVKGTR
jgi:hypothetical protein